MAGLILALFAAVLQGTPPASADPADDIVVLAHRMKQVRWEFDAQHGTLVKCAIRRSSGSALVDGLVCKATAQCAAQQPATSDQRLVPCIKDRVRMLYPATKEAGQ